MCGRFSLFTEPARLAAFFDAELAPDVDPEGRPRWNIGPTTRILGLAIPEGGGERPTISRYRWGLVPPWAKDGGGSSRLINARGETVATKPSFRSAFAHRRMAVLADGFFEWQKGRGGVKHPHYFHRTDGNPLAFAGLWEGAPAARLGAAGQDDGPSPTCTIVTTAAGQDMDGIHDRMPAVLEPADLRRWLEPDGAEREELLALLRPATPGTLVHHPVDQRVGNIRNDDPGVIEAVTR
jgi:putative SOS response-associated peptidase YedK